MVGLEVIEIEPCVAHSEQLVPLVECFFIAPREGQVDSKDALPVHRRTAAARSGLNPEEVVQEGSHEERVENLAVPCLDYEGKDWHFGKIVVAKEIQVWDLRESIHGSLLDFLLQGTDSLYSDLLSELVDEASPDVLDHTRSSRFLKLLNIRHKVMVLLIDEKDWTTTDSVRSLVVQKHFRGQEDPRRAWATHQFVR